MQRRDFTKAIVLTVAITAALASAQVALAQPVPLRKEHAYSGPRRAITQLATVYGTTLTRPSLALTYICEVDGKSYRATIAFGSISICPSIVYLAPGSHRLLIHH